MVDARYEQVRIDNLVRDCAVLIALGIDDKGKREVLGVQVSLSETEVYWREFLGDLQKRGMHGTKLIISDTHSGIKVARKAITPGCCLATLLVPSSTKCSSLCHQAKQEEGCSSRHTRSL